MRTLTTHEISRVFIFADFDTRPADTPASIYMISAELRRLAARYDFALPAFRLHDSEFRPLASTAMHNILAY